MEIRYNVTLPPKNMFLGGKKSEEAQAIEDFMTSGNVSNMCFEYETAEEAKTRAASVRSFRKKWNELNPTKQFDSYRVDRCVYIIKMKGKSK